MPPEDDARSTYRELRLALVFNGGVSLAVWMGGVSKELDRFRGALHYDTPTLAPHRELLDALRTDVVTDVIAGTSAGGMNGAMLGYCVANGMMLEGEDGNRIRDCWRELADIGALLEPDGPPQSALDDKRLFRGCANVFTALSAGARQLGHGVSTQVRLSVTATDSAGYVVREMPELPERSSDDLGVGAVDHRIEMRFRHIDRPSASSLRLSPALREVIARVAGPTPHDAWPFADRTPRRSLTEGDAPALLTRAARTTASFPIAFGPSELPLDEPTAGIGDPEQLDSTSPDLTATPPMREVIVRRGGTPPPDDLHTLWGIDGGLWANAPFDAVLRSIDRMPAARDVARRLVYVVYTAEQDARPESPDAPQLVRSVTQALCLPSDVSFASDLERINADMRQQQRRRSRATSLLSPGGPDIVALAAEMVAITDGAPEGLTVLDPDAGLVAWRATATDWQWGARPARTAIEEARRLVRELLRGVATAGGDVGPWLEARDALSQLAWVLGDLEGLDGPETSKAAVCGQVVHDFAALVQQLQRPLQDVRGVPADGARALAEARALSAGDHEQVIKRVIAFDVCLNALAADRRPRRVDYRPATIRPDTRWPDGSDGRPQLAGIQYGHFGGFLRASWRLNDWMWGRLDGNSEMIEMLVDVEQVRRLTSGAPPETVRRLAERLASVAGDPQLADDFERDVAAAAADRGTNGNLDRVRSALKLRFRRAILRDELGGVAKAINDENGNGALDVEKLGSEADDAGLSTVVTALPAHVPLLKLSQYGERAAANVAEAIHHAKLADHLRSLAQVEDNADAAIHAVKAAKEYVSSRLPWHSDAAR